MVRTFERNKSRELYVVHTAIRGAKVFKSNLFSVENPMGQDNVCTRKGGNYLTEILFSYVQNYHLACCFQGNILNHLPELHV